MKKLIAVLLIAPSSCFAGNYATCLLDKMPGIENDAIAMATNKVCLDKYPGGFNNVQQGSGRGYFSYDSGAECAAKIGSKTRSLTAGRMIFASCNVLYEKPKTGLFDDILNK